MRIDVHTHAHPTEYLDALLNSGRYEVAQDASSSTIIKAKGSRFLSITPEMHDPARRVEDMEQNGIDLQVISLSTPQVYFLEGQACVDMARLTNDYLAGIVQQYPDRFRALASVPLTASIDAAIDEYVRCDEQLGMPGFLIGANIEGTPIDDPRFTPFYEEANRRGAIMFIHPMVPPGVEAMNDYALAPLVGFMMDTTLAIARLIFSGFLTRYPDITVIAGHLGATAPYLAGRLDIGWRAYPDCQGIDESPKELLKRIYVDTVSFHQPALRCAIETLGVGQILFGTDYPHVIGDVSGALHDIQSLGLDDRDINGILGDVAARLLGGLKGDASTSGE